MLNRILFVAILLTAMFGSLAFNVVTAQSQPPKTNLTGEWIFSDEGRRVASLPSSFWLSDGKLMLFDGRKPEAERVFEVLDPATGVRRVDG